MFAVLFDTACKIENHTKYVSYDCIKWFEIIIVAGNLSKTLISVYKNVYFDLWESTRIIKFVFWILVKWRLQESGGKPTEGMMLSGISGKK